MLEITPTGQFKKDFKTCKKRGYDMDLLPTTLAGPYFKADIPNISIDYRGLTAFARNKGCKICDLTDEEKNRFITDADMNIVRECAIKLSAKYFFILLFSNYNKKDTPLINEIVL